MEKVVTSSLGYVAPKSWIDSQEYVPGTIACMDNPFVMGQENPVGTITIGSDVFRVTVLWEFSEYTAHIFKGETLFATVNIHSGTGLVGFCAQYSSLNTVRIFFIANANVDASGAQAWYDTVQQVQLPAPGIPYTARELYSGSDSILEEQRDWDDQPSTDIENDPFNELPQGGEYAEVGDYAETYLQMLSELDEPETLNYGHFLTAYQLESSNLVDIGDFLFDAGFWTSLKNKFEGLSDPLSMIVSAVEIPFTLGVVPTTFKLGGVEVTDGNGDPILCSKHTGRYLKYSFGSITLKEVWGTAKDYTNCDISIFLPYVGMRQIDPDLGVNSVLTLAAIIDVWTGDLNYMLEVNNSSMQSKYFASSGVPYRWSGNCGNKIPIGKVDPSTPILNVAASLGSIAIGAGMFALSGGIAAPGAAAGIGAGLSGNAAMAGAGAGMILSGAKSAAGDLSNGFSPIAQSSGNISGAIGYMDFQYPYLVIKRGVPSYPNNWRAEIGAPRYQEFQVSSLSGYTEFAEIHADAINGASDEEKLMIEDFLKAGVIL